MFISSSIIQKERKEEGQGKKEREKSFGRRARETKKRLKEGDKRNMHGRANDEGGLRENSENPKSWETFFSIEGQKQCERLPLTYSLAEANKGCLVKGEG